MTYVTRAKGRVSCVTLSALPVPYITSRVFLEPRGQGPPGPRSGLPRQARHAHEAGRRSVSDKAVLSLRKARAGSRRTPVRADRTPGYHPQNRRLGCRAPRTHGAFRRVTPSFNGVFASNRRFPSRKTTGAPGPALQRVESYFWRIARTVPSLS